MGARIEASAEGQHPKAYILSCVDSRVPVEQVFDQGIGDIFVEPITLSWHGAQHDAGVGYGFWIPSGDFDPNRPALIWKGFWSHMFTAGGTWYPDKDKTWSVSLLNRYEFHHEHQDLGIRPGQTLTLKADLARAQVFDPETGMAL